MNSYWTIFSWPIRIHSQSSHTADSYLLVISNKKLYIIDPGEEIIKNTVLLREIQKFSYDRKSENIFRINLINGKILVLSSKFRDKILHCLSAEISKAKDLPPSKSTKIVNDMIAFKLITDNINRNILVFSDVGLFICSLSIAKIILSGSFPKESSYDFYRYEHIHSLSHGSFPSSIIIHLRDGGYVTISVANFENIGDFLVLLAGRAAIYSNKSLKDVIFPEKVPDTVVVDSPEVEHRVLPITDKPDPQTSSTYIHDDHIAPKTLPKEIQKLPKKDYSSKPSPEMGVASSSPVQEKNKLYSFCQNPSSIRRYSDSVDRLLSTHSYGILTSPPPNTSLPQDAPMQYHSVPSHHFRGQKHPDQMHIVGKKQERMGTEEAEEGLRESVKDLEDSDESDDALHR
ncbi:hypothetical protein ADUPG1_009414, partial [Aduncisulcus paluster]